eukprot:SAG11_NODE_7132_length_1189_cov_0.800000_2_plen_102_part_00
MLIGGFASEWLNLLDLLKRDMRVLVRPLVPLEFRYDGRCRRVIGAREVGNPVLGDILTLAKPNVRKGGHIVHEIAQPLDSCWVANKPHVQPTACNKVEHKQ